MGEGQTNTPVNHHNQGEVMTARIEKTVFISYRRTNFWTALAVFQNLYANGYDVFFDYKSIPSGDFEQVITENVKSRAHFIVILSPSALERCNEPGDWLRREIETAIENKRNIIPLMMEGFKFGSSTTVKALTGKLAELKKYNAMGIPVEYFEEAMGKLRGDRFLNKPLESVFHPVSNVTTQITEEQKSAASEAPPVEKEQLTAQEWFERGYVFNEDKNYDEAIRCYTEAIGLKPNEIYLAAIYSNRGGARKDKGDLDGAISDLDEATRLNPDFVEGYNNRGVVRQMKKEFVGAIEDFNKAILLKPDYAMAYTNRGNARRAIGDLQGAIEDHTLSIELKNPELYLPLSNRGNALYEKGDLDVAIIDLNKAINLKPDFAMAYNNRGTVHFAKDDLENAIADYDKAIANKPDFTEAYLGRGTARYKKNDLDEAIADLSQAIRLKPDLTDAYITRGAIFSLKRDNLNALFDFQTASKLEPGDGTIRASLVRVLKNLGLKRESKEQEQIARVLIQKEKE